MSVLQRRKSRFEGLNFGFLRKGYKGIGRPGGGRYGKDAGQPRRGAGYKTGFREGRPVGESAGSSGDARKASANVAPVRNPPPMNNTTDLYISRGADRSP